MVGGLARRVYWLKEKRKKGEPSLLLEAGDSLFPGEYARGDIYQKRADYLLEVYGKLGYDAFGLGRRDLPFGIGFLKEQSKKHGIEFLSANLLLKGKKPFKPYKIFEVGSSKVAVISVISPRNTKTWEAMGISAVHPKRFLLKTIPELRKKADLVVLLSNLGEMEDRLLVKEVPGIDLVIGSGLGSRFKFPVKVADRTFMVRPQSRGKSIGWVEIGIPFNGNEKEIKGELVFLAGAVKDDPEVAKKVEELEKETRNWERIHRKKVPSSPENRKNAAKGNPFLKAIEKAKRQRKALESKGQKGGSSSFIEMLKKGQTSQPAAPTNQDSLRIK